jgi:hypothetical protein
MDGFEMLVHALVAALLIEYLIVVFNEHMNNKKGK